MIRTCPGWMGLNHGPRLVSNDGIEDGKVSTVLCEDCKRHTAKVLDLEDAERRASTQYVADRVNRYVGAAR